MEHDVLVVIPSRLASVRFPGKPLALAGELPLLWYTWQAVKDWPRAADVLIATPDDAIRGAMTALGAKVVMTAPSLRNGSQRAFAAYLAYGPRLRALVNLQCDASGSYRGMRSMLCGRGL